MNPSALSGTRKHLIRQLVFFDEQYSSFMEQYFPEPGKEKLIAEQMIRRYSETLEKLLPQSDDELAESLHSIVLLGSRVKVHFEEDGLEESFTIVYPTEIEPNQNRISFLSPIGKQLLFAAPNTSVALVTPIGKQNVRVRDLKFAYIGGFSTE